eukprot:5458072-Prorocentrum_lima.AAC.1
MTGPALASRWRSLDWWRQEQHQQPRRFWMKAGNYFHHRQDIVVKHVEQQIKKCKAAGASAAAGVTWAANTS